jgi:hypothetical protein
MRGTTEVWQTAWCRVPTQPGASYRRALRSVLSRRLPQRTLTCHQLMTLLCGRLDPLLTAHHIGLVILTGPLHHFFR